VSIFCVVAAARVWLAKSDVALGDAVRVVADAGWRGASLEAGAGAAAGGGVTFTVDVPGRALGAPRPTSTECETTTAGAPCTGFCAWPGLADVV